MDGGAWWAEVHGIAESWTRLSDFTFTFHFPALEKEMATHSSVLAWRTPGTGEPGGLPSLGSHRVGHDWSDLAAAAAAAVVIVTGKGHQWDFLGSPMVKTLPSNAGGSSSIPGRAAKILHAACHGQKKKKPSVDPKISGWRVKRDRIFTHKIAFHTK